MTDPCEYLTGLRLSQAMPQYFPRAPAARDRVGLETIVGSSPACCTSVMRTRHALAVMYAGPAASRETAGYPARPDGVTSLAPSISDCRN